MGVEGFVGTYLREQKFKNVELKRAPNCNSLLIDCNSLFHDSSSETYAYGKFEDEKIQAELLLIDPEILELKFLDLIIVNLKKVIQTFTGCRQAVKPITIHHQLFGAANSTLPLAVDQRGAVSSTVDDIVTPLSTVSITACCGFSTRRA